MDQTRDDLQLARARDADKGADGGIDIRRAPLIAIEARLVAGQRQEFPQRLEILLLLLLL